MTPVPRRTFDRRVRYLVTAGLLFAFAGVAFAALQEEPQEGWPREIPIEGASVLIFQPQSDTFEGNILTGRAAVSVTVTNREPVFGVVWYEARLETDRDTRTATVEDLTVTRVGFPGSEEAHQDSLARLLESEGQSRMPVL